MIKKIIFSILITSSFLDAAIQKITTLAEVKKYTTPDIELVVTDIHDTLIKAFYPGCVKKMREFEMQGRSIKPEERYITFRWNAVKPTESDVLDVFVWLQRTFNLIALTKGEPEEEPYILDQLAAVGIDFSKDFSDWPRTCLQTKNARCVALFNQGIIFSKLYDKCTALQLFLKKFKLVEPKKIMLIDNNLENHQAFEQCSSRLGFDYIGLWYQPDWLQDYYKSGSC